MAIPGCLVLYSTTMHLAAITVYPLKSFTGQPVRQTRVLLSGALEHDRQFALFDDTGRTWNAKRTPLVHRWRTWFSAEHRVLTLRDGIEEHAWNLDRERDALQRWFAERFGGLVRLEENVTVGFPDDVDASGPTIVSTASLREVTRWFPGLTIDDVRQRFRANLEIDGVPAFWEDRLARADGTLQPLRIGAATFGGVNPCQRCAVPTRDAQSGDVLPSFQKVFAERRAATLPAWAAPVRFDHFYRFTANTRLISTADCIISVGDAIELIDAAAEKP
jgi:uncharacterized protein YcbX